MPRQGSRSASSAGHGTMFASHTASALRKQSSAEQNRRTGALRGKGRGGACTDSTCVQRSPVTAGIAQLPRVSVAAYGESADTQHPRLSVTPSMLSLTLQQAQAHKDRRGAGAATVARTAMAAVSTHRTPRQTEGMRGTPEDSAHTTIGQRKSRSGLDSATISSPGDASPRQSLRS